MGGGEDGVNGDVCSSGGIQEARLRSPCERMPVVPTAPLGAAAARESDTGGAAGTSGADALEKTHTEPRGASLWRTLRPSISPDQRELRPTQARTDVCQPFWAAWMEPRTSSQINQ
jgi:hypothetical protein